MSVAVPSGETRAPGAGQAGARPSASPPLLVLGPAAVVVLGWALLGHFDGGYKAHTWYPSALLALGLGTAVAVGLGRVLPENRWARAALLALAAFTAWSYLSIAWSGSPGAGWEAANKQLLYLVVAWLFSLLPWTPRTAAYVLGAFVAGAVVVCAASLLGALAAPNFDGYFIKGRYIDPIGYSNAVAALPVIALWPALLLASRRSTPRPLRPLFLASAAFLLAFSLLPQSRGSFIGLAVALPAFVALASDRLRLIAPLAVVAGAGLITAAPSFDVNTVGTKIDHGLTTASLGPTLDHAARVMGLTTLAVLVVGVVLVALDDRVRPSAAALRRTRTVVAVALGALALGGLVAGAANAGRISDSLGDRWQTFKSNEGTPDVIGTRLFASGSEQRYDYWRVALNLFRERPLVGIGAGGYGDRYNAVRRHAKPSRYAHDIWLRTLAEGGLIGFGLLLAWLIAALGGLVAVSRRLSGDARGVVAACFAACVYFFAHSSFDWLEEFPALASPAFALPFVGLALAGSGPRSRQRRFPGWVGPAAVATLVVAGCLSLAAPYLSLLYAERAPSQELGDARRSLSRAARLNPLDPQPHFTEGNLEVAAGNFDRARLAFKDGIEVQDAYYGRLQLAILDAQRGDFRSASRELARGRQLASRDFVLSRAADIIAGRDRVDPRRFNREVRAETRQSFTAPEK